MLIDKSIIRVIKLFCMKDTVIKIVYKIDTVYINSFDTIFIKNEIGNKATEDNTLFTNLLTILLALIAGLVALYQVKSNTISSARITWIENLRNTLSEYSALVNLTITKLKNMIEVGTKLANPDYDGFRDDYQSYLSTSNKVSELGYKVKLYVNPAEKDHMEIVKLIEKIDHTLEKRKIQNIDTAEVQNDIDLIISKSKTIFKTEWTKSKRLFKI